MISPRIAALQNALHAGDRAELDRFWAAVAAHGTPLVESIPGDPDHVLLTMLWRAGSEVDNVAVEGGPGGLGLDHLRRLAGTDVWHRSYRVPADTRCAYRFWENVGDGEEEPHPARPITPEQLSMAKVDPLNPRRAGSGPASHQPVRFRRDLVSSVVELSGALPQPWADPRRDVPAGTIHEHHFRSDVLGNERLIWVRIPPGSDRSAGWPWVLAFDGTLMVDGTLSLPPTLDNTQAAGVAPAMVAAMVSNPDPPTRMRELPCFPPFMEFLGEELVPWLHDRYPLTTDPSRVIVTGASHGGLAAAFAGLRRPDLFGNVLSLSGSYWWRPAVHEEPEWLTHQVAAAPTVAHRWYLEVGRFEYGDAPSGGPDTLTCNRHLRDALVARACDVAYAEFSGGHDTICWRGALGNGLVHLTQRWDAPAPGDHGLAASRSATVRRSTR